jgi:response regulator RpfG family c-di-GMP phosphodiesterase
VSDKQRIGKYEIESLIGKESDSALYRGLDGAKPVALKVINRNPARASALESFKQRVPALARLRHPPIAGLLEFVETDKALCLAYELAEGETLDARIQADGRPNLRQAWEIARQILDALAVAHHAGIVHGDLTPAKIFVDRQGRLKVAGFGAAGLAADTAATPLYMAPEQFRRAEADVRTDLYQAGVIVYQLTTHKLPFTGTREELAQRVPRDRPADPSSHSPKVAWQLDWVIQRALSKIPADRFGSAREFLEGLRLGLQESLGTPLTMPPSPITAATLAAAAGPGRPTAAAASVSTQAQSPTPKATAVSPPAPKAATIPPASKVPGAESPVPKAAMAAIAAAKAQVPKPVEKPAEKPVDDGRIRVLFVDDEERVLNALRALFRPEYQVFTAESGALALDIVKREAIQVVVSDQRMPQMTGVELLRQVKKEAPQTVRILLTGYSDLAALVGSVNEGEIFRFAKKPWDNDEIRATLAEAAAMAAKLAPQAAAKAQSPRSAGSLLVIDPGQGLATGLKRLLAGAATVHLAASPREAAKILQTQDVAAVIADIAAGKDGLVALFKLLKAKRPETLSILVADEPDSELVAELVNQAQIYRFLAKPVNARELRSHVSEALRRYAAFTESRQRAKDPDLAERLGAPAGRPVSRTA